MLKRGYKLIACLMIWIQVLSGSGVAMNGTRRFLSPEININKIDLKNSLEAYSKAKIEQALKKTAQTINDIGKRNFKRELSPREIVVALSMVLEGKSLRDVDGHFDSLNYLLEGFGIKRKPKQTRKIRILRGISVLFFAVSFNFTVLDIVKERYHIGHFITYPLFLSFAWYFIGWVVDFFSWAEKKIDPKNKYQFEDPAKDLNTAEKEEFLRHIKKTIENVINNRFDEYSKTSGNYDQHSRLMDLDLPVSICPITINYHNMMLNAI